MEINYAAFLEDIVARASPLQESLAASLGEPVADSSQPLPAWAVVLRAFFEDDPREHLFQDGAKEASLRPQPAAQFNIEAVYQPLVAFGRSLVRQRAGARLVGQIDGAAHVDLENHLLKRLTWAGSSAVQLQFAVFQALAGIKSVASDESRPSNPDEQFDQFLGSGPKNRLSKLFQDYPVHAKQCGILVQNWVAMVVKFLTRLSDDQSELNTRFGGERGLGVAARIDPSLSDPHSGGEIVLSIAFASGLQLIYKPRSLAAEEHFAALLAWAGDARSFRQFKTPAVWDRGDYGWVEYVTAAACRDRRDVRRFYWRCGALLGWIHLARGVDCHRDNLVAAGEHPVLVDLDTLWHPLGDGDGNSANALSVLPTGFLPGGNLAENMAYAFSSIEIDPDVARAEAPLPPPAAPVAQSPSHRAPHHLPSLNGSPLRATRYLREILAGFRWVGKRHLQDEQRRDWLVHWLAQLQKIPRRRIHRSSAVYSQLLKRITTPKYLRDGRAHGSELESLLDTSPGPAVGREEIRALECLGIPYFSSAASEDGGRVPPSVPDLAEYLSQLAVIRGSLSVEPRATRES